MLRFTWQLVAGEVIQSYEVHLLCRHAAKHGVRTPKEWKNELNLGRGVEALDNLAGAAVRRARDEFGLSESVKLDCRPPQFMNARTFIGGRNQLACVHVLARVFVYTWVCSRVAGILDHLVSRLGLLSSPSVGLLQ